MVRSEGRMVGMEFSEEVGGIKTKDWMCPSLGLAIVWTQDTAANKWSFKRISHGLERRLGG